MHLGKIFLKVNKFFLEDKFSLDKCINITTDGAVSLTRTQKEFKGSPLKR